MVLLGLLIINEGFTALAIPSGFVAGDFDDGEPGVALAEDAVHFLKGAVGGFGVEKVDDWEDAGVAVGS